MDALKPLQTLLDNLQSRLSLVEEKIGMANNPSISKPKETQEKIISPPSKQEQLSPSIIAYDDYESTYLKPFLDSCDKLGEGAISLGKIIEDGFKEQRKFLVMASLCKKPSQQDLISLLADLQKYVKEMDNKRDNRSDFSHHQNMLTEGIQSLGWLCIEPAPKPYIESYIGGADFWGNKIRVQYKSSNQDQINFVNSFKQLLTQLMAYVKQYHTTGVEWNPQGISCSSYSPPSEEAQNSDKKPLAGAGMNAIFAGIKSIDQSSGRTAGLKTVTKDMQTWRKEYKDDKSVPGLNKKATASLKEVDKPSKPPRCEEKDGAWEIEYQGQGPPVTVEDLNMKQKVYIYGCVGATIILKGKCKSIVLDSCKKSNLIFDNAVSSVEIVNCKQVKVQSKGRVPSIAIDKTDGCLIYVSYEGKDVQFVTSKSSEMNVSFPSAPSSDEYIEVPIPEQFVHKITENNKISSGVSDLYSH